MAVIGASPTPTLSESQIDEVREHLEMVLSSPAFANAERSRRLLRYLVESALQNNADCLKEYVIGLEVFDRNADYDPRIDSTVRVQVGKLRERLNTFYLSSNRLGGIRIELPKGGYAPLFVFPAPEFPPTSPNGARRSVPPSLRWIAAASILGVLAGGVTVWITQRTRPPRFRQITFRRGSIGNARFSPAGNSILYSARWGNSPPEIFSTTTNTVESRSLGFPNAELLALARNETLAIQKKPMFVGPPSLGTLAITPLTGAAARDLLEDVSSADWSPDSSKLAIASWSVPGKRRLEYPPGKVLYETSPTGWVSGVRVSPRGDYVAFIDHRANVGDDEGWISVVDRNGHKRDLTGRWPFTAGLAWRSNQEIWFCAGDDGISSTLRAVTLSGAQRSVINLPSACGLHDIAADGRALMTVIDERVEMSYASPGSQTQIDMSWLDGSFIRDMSADGSALLFDEEGAGGGATASIYIRNADGTPPTRLADGFGLALSPDRKWVLARRRSTSPPSLLLLPTGAGEERPLTAGAIRYQEPGAWFPDGKRLLLIGSEPKHRPLNFVYDIAANHATPVTPEGILGHVLTPDGKHVTVRSAEGLKLMPIDGGESTLVRGTTLKDIPLRWTADGEHLFVMRGRMPGVIERISARDGKREPWMTLAPADPTGVTTIYSIAISQDGRACAYSFLRYLSTLYQVEGLH